MIEQIREILEMDLIRVAEYSFSVYDLLKLFFYFLVGKGILWILKQSLKKYWKFKDLDQGSQYALYQILKYIIWVIITVLALESIGVKVTILVAGSAALLVGIGLGVQQTFNDFFSGILLLVEGSIKVGDVLEVDDEVVRVKRIGLRTSIVENREEIIIILPNSKIVTDKVINWSHNVKIARFSFIVGVSYGTDEDLVIRILKEVAKGHTAVMQEKEPIVRLNSFGDSSLNFELMFWTREMFRVEQIKSDMRLKILKKFRDQKVVIPFPQRDLHLKSTNISFKE
ncbi:mechanosensitive ion channel family protein [Flexithrix dorotheae]|uniref:mechanosensitive ion channel family protein n=1 Tax=Flexithrix dorotheae TaxID=70993 RepID=UPI00036F29E4|nr:mechanosensitive ion channel domain-containing protein [Flexithrix dorotheae]